MSDRPRRTSQRYAEQVDSTAWLAPEKTPIKSADGKFMKPPGGPPVPGYTWNFERGVWIPGRTLWQEMAQTAEASRRQHGSRRGRRHSQRKRKPDAASAANTTSRDTLGEGTTVGSNCSITTIGSSVIESSVPSMEQNLKSPLLLKHASHRMKGDKKDESPGSPESTLTLVAKPDVFLAVEGKQSSAFSPPDSIAIRSPARPDRPEAPQLKTASLQEKHLPEGPSGSARSIPNDFDAAKTKAPQAGPKTKNPQGQSASVRSIPNESKAVKNIPPPVAPRDKDQEKQSASVRSTPPIPTGPDAAKTRSLQAEPESKDPEQPSTSVKLTPPIPDDSDTAKNIPPQVLNPEGRTAPVHSTPTIPIDSGTVKNIPPQTVPGNEELHVAALEGDREGNTEEAQDMALESPTASQATTGKMKLSMEGAIKRKDDSLHNDDVSKLQLTSEPSEKQTQMSLKNAPAQLPASKAQLLPSGGDQKRKVTYAEYKGEADASKMATGQAQQPIAAAVPNPFSSNTTGLVTDAKTLSQVDKAAKTGEKETEQVGTAETVKEHEMEATPHQDSACSDFVPLVDLHPESQEAVAANDLSHDGGKLIERLSEATQNADLIAHERVVEHKRKLMHSDDFEKAKKTREDESMSPNPETLQYQQKQVPNPGVANHLCPDRTLPVDLTVSWHPLSQYKEPAPSLSDCPAALYERFRAPLRPASGRMWYSLSALQQEVRCGICLDLITNARIVRECLHRFCDTCIERAVNQFGGKRECPICRVAIPSRRSLADDANFNNLLISIRGKVDPSSEVAPSNKLQEAINRKRKAMASKREVASGDAEQFQEEIVGDSFRRDPSLLVKVKLIQAGDRERLRAPFIKLSGDASVGVLRSFLIQKHAIQSVDLWALYRGEKEFLSDQTKLRGLLHRMSSSVTPSGHLPIFYK